MFWKLPQSAIGSPRERGWPCSRQEAAAAATEAAKGYRERGSLEGGSPSEIPAALTNSDVVVPYAGYGNSIRGLYRE